MPYGIFDLVAAVVVRANLAAEGVLAFDDDRLARLDPQARLVVAAEFVVERAEGESFHGGEWFKVRWFLSE